MQPEGMTGQVVGHYRIVRPVGYGGMATVFLAEDIHLHRQVAIKVFQPKPGETGDFLRRFAREARVLAQLDHPNILLVHDYGEQNGLAYLVMPYMAKGSLKDLLQAHKVLPIPETIQLAGQMLQALQYAHERGLIHRDIKPGNMLFKADGTLLLADFGIVKVLSADGGNASLLEASGQPSRAMSGTPQYMAPEQIRGQATPLSDIYSVGVVLYEMLTGTRPFVADNVMGIWMKHLYEQPRSLHEINPQIPPQLDAVVLLALEKDEARRYQHPIDFLQALIQATAPDRPVTAAERPGPTNLAAWSPSVQAPIVASHDISSDEHRTLSDGTATTPISTLASESLSAPTQRLRSRSSRRLVVTLALMVVLLVGVVSVALGLSLLGSHVSPTPTPGATSIVKKNHFTPTVTTAPVPATLTTCPATGTARAAIMPHLALGAHQNIVYAVNEGSPDAPTLTTLKRYDVAIKAKTEIVNMPNTYIDEAQVSEDGQWILFIAHVKGQVELRMVRMDGQGLQTLSCAPSGKQFSNAQWSANQKLLAFDEGGQLGAPTMYLLNMESGTLQPELLPTNQGMGFWPRTWLDNTHIYLVGFVPNSDAPLRGLYLLDTSNGPNQQGASLQQVLKVSGSCWDFDNSFDGTELFVSQCTPGQHGSGSVRLLSPTGDTSTTILTSSTLAIASIRYTDSGLLLSVSNTALGFTNGDMSQDGLWMSATDGTGLTRLTINNSGETGNLNPFTQDPWSNVSRDGKMYAYSLTNYTSNTATLLLGSLSGGKPTAFATVSGGTQLAIVGWTTM